MTWLHLTSYDPVTSHWPEEYLWHVILLDEFIWKQQSQMRVRFEAQTLWGPGGLIGLRVFFRRLTQAQVSDAVRILAADMKARGVLVLGMHFLPMDVMYVAEIAQSCL